MIQMTNEISKRDEQILEVMRKKGELEKENNNTEYKMEETKKEIDLKDAKLGQLHLRFNRLKLLLKSDRTEEEKYFKEVNNSELCKRLTQLRNLFKYNRNEEETYIEFVNEVL